MKDVIAEKITKRESFLIANDGQYLGKLTLNVYDIDSIFNTFGFYGSKFSSTSIWNKYNNYGSPYSSLSPFNRFTNTPPQIYLKGKKIGLLTRNRYLGSGNVDPDDLQVWMQKNRLER